MPIIRVYTDGSCINNQNSKKGGSFGGYGCHIDYPNGMEEEFSQGIIGKKVTNNVGELMGYKMGLERIMQLKTRDIVHVYTDSMYVINTYVRDIKNWENNGWKKANGKDIENLELIQEIQELMQDSGLIIILKKWKAHTVEPARDDPTWCHWNGNNRADIIAKDCATDMMNSHNEKKKAELLAVAQDKEEKKMKKKKKTKKVST